MEVGASSARIYTLLANCKEQGSDPERYLAMVLRRLPTNAAIEQAAGLRPRRG